MDTIEYLKLELKSAWGEIEIPKVDQLLKFIPAIELSSESSCNSVDRVFLYELLNGKLYNEYNYFIDDTFENYLTNTAFCYYLGGWIDDIIYYLPNDPNKSSNSSLIFFSRISNLKEMRILLEFFTKNQLKVLIKVCNLYLDYKDYYFPSLNKIDSSAISEVVREARIKLGI